MAEEKKTLHDIASLLRVPAEQDTVGPEAKADPEPQEDAMDDVPPTEGNDDDDQLELELAEPEVEDDAEDDDPDPETLEEGEDEDEEAENDAEQDSYLDIRDDDLIEVKIDGEVQLRSIGEAKKALSGEGAIEKRLKEATEARKAAQAEHTQLLEQFSTAHKNLVNVISGLDDIVFVPQVERPDAKLKQSDPDAYYRQLADYQEDQERVSQGKQAVRQLVQRQQQAFEQDRARYRDEQAQLLQERLPDITDAQKAPELVGSMREVAKSYGFTDAEIQNAMDHRYFLMVADLAKLQGKRGAVQRKANTVKNLEGQAAKRPRKLRSGATQLKNKARKQADRQKKTADRARSTGKVKDVAATLIQTRG